MPTNNTPDSPHPDLVPVQAEHALSRRSLIGTAAVVSGASLVALGRSDSVSAFAPTAEPLLSAPVDGLTYIGLDAFAFDVAGTSPTAYRLYQEITGMQPQPASDHLYASLPIPIGSVIKQINVSYQNQPIVAVVRRDLATGAYTDLTPVTGLDAGTGVSTQTLAVNGELTQGATYGVRVFCSAGDSVLGMTIGYIPPAQAFIPFSGANPRALDTRSGARVAAGAEVVVDLSTFVIPTARAAVLNVTAVQVGGRGFLSVYRDGITFPGNSSVNYTEAGQTVANGVITAMTNGKIKVRAGDTSTHLLVDVIGSLL
jgi:hypothetical protein